MATSDGSGSTGMKALLAKFFIGNARVTVDKLVLTSIGRVLRDAGVEMLKEQISANGFLDQFAPIVCLMTPLLEGESLADAVAVEGARFKVLDGNHRTAAQVMLDKERGTGPTEILVEVHRCMPAATERILTAGD